MKTLGCFVSSHGYGHATRMSAVLSSLADKTDIHPHIVTSVNAGIFQQSLIHFTYHRHQTDIGFSQIDAFTIDLEETVSNLGALLPYRDREIDILARKLEGSSIVLCDISPMGIAVARRLGVPSVVIENFTWDWLYSQYSDRYPRLGFFARYLQQQFSQASYHIQTEPVCVLKEGALHCGPIFRSIREKQEDVRKQLQPGSNKIVLITLGGISFDPTFIDKLSSHTNYIFYLCGQDRNCRLSDNINLLKRDTDLYHPDLIHSADLVVFKSGYSTLAEVYQAGTPSIIIQREGFAESKAIESFARKHLCSEVIPEKSFSSGKWLDLLPSLVISKTTKQPVKNGAEQVADFLLSLL